MKKRVKQAKRTRRVSAAEFIQDAVRSMADHLRTLVFPSPMVTDEIGFLPISRTGAIL
jgi:hypothetical protein